MECLFPRKKRSRDINHRRPSFQHRILDMVSSTGGSSPLNVSSPLSQLKRAESYATIVSTRSTTVPHSHSHSHTATGSASTAVVVPQYSATVGSSTGSRFSVIHVTDTNSAAATISPGRNGLDSTISDVVTKLPARLTQQSSQSHSRPPLPFMMGSHQQQQLQQQQQQNHKRSESVPSRRWSARADAFMQPFAGELANVQLPAMPQQAATKRTPFKMMSMSRPSPTVVANDGSTAARDNTEQFIGNADVNESNLTAAAPVPATIVQSATTRSKPSPRHTPQEPRSQLQLQPQPQQPAPSTPTTRLLSSVVGSHRRGKSLDASALSKSELPDNSNSTISNADGNNTPAVIIEQCNVTNCSPWPNISLPLPTPITPNHQRSLSMPRGARPHPLDIPSTPTVSMMPLAIGAGSGGEPRTPTGVTSSMSTIPISQSNSNVGGGTLTSPSGVISLKLTIPSSQQQQQQQHPSTEKVGTTIATTIATTTSNGGILSPASSGFNRSALVSASGNSSLIFNRTTPPMMSDISAWPTAPATPVVSMNAMGNVFASMSDFRPPVMMAALPPPPPAMSDSSCATAVDDTASDMTRVAYCTRARVSPAIVTQIPMSNKTIKRRSTVISGDELSRYQRKMEEALATGVPPTSSMATTAAAVAQFEPYVGNHVAIGGHGNLGLNMNPVALSSLKSGSNNTMGLTARHVRLKSVY